VIRPRNNGHRRAIRPPSLLDVERIRRKLIEDGRPPDATLISVLAHVGLRPSEALALEWDDIDMGRMQIVVDKSVELDGSTKSTKTRRNRVASIPRLVKPALRAWKRACSTGLVFPRSDGLPVDRGSWNNFRKRVIAPIQDDLGLPRFRLYDLRHVAVSARLSAGQNPLQVAYETGHDPSVMFSTYSHCLPAWTVRRRVMTR
jgi:integrase